MELEVKVVIPTMSRVNTMITHNYVSNTIICPPDSQKKAYKSKYPHLEVVSHPDTVKGLGPKREWIYRKFGNVFMMDDDVKGFSRMTQKIRESSSVSPDLAYHLIQNCANMAKLVGCYLFSFSSLKRPEHYSGHDPIKLTGCMNECAFGLLKGASKLKIEPNITLAYEFYISGLNAYWYRKAYYDTRYSINQDGFGDNIGGCADVRTNKVEEQDYNLLRHFFGSAISIKTAGNTRAKHKHSKTLNVPF